MVGTKKVVNQKSVKFYLKSYKRVLALGLLIGISSFNRALAQAVFEPWGNISGIKLKGQLVSFGSGITIIGKNWSKIQSTGKERQRPKYSRNGNEQTVITQIDGFNITEILTSNSNGKISLTISCSTTKDTTINGIYLEVRLPPSIYAGSFKLLDVQEQASTQLQPSAQSDYLHSYAGGIQFRAGDKLISIRSATTSPIVIIPDKDTINKNLHIYFPIGTGTLFKGQKYEATYVLKVMDKINHVDASLMLDTTTQGRPFAGLGGNFRLQNVKTDQQVIDYCLTNMRVAWGRVEMPWRNWQPDINADPIQAAANGALNNHVKESMEMAQRLGKMNFPVIVTAWAPPAWAVEGKLNNGRSPEGIWGNPLNKTVTQQIYRSITDYIIYLRDHYGVEASCFSFNESDLGINVRQTPEEHDELIKGLGAYFASKGLKTKLLLGDNSDATTYRFIEVALNDAAARPYIGAISFHSWRGWDTATLQKWADAAATLKLPLIVGEGSIDAAAWAYPAYFLEDTYAQAEISLYVRLLAICQPAAILQWQLTADYSPLAGGGIFGDNGALRPTQRFWNLKQIASTPPGLFAMPLTTDQKEIVCAALGDHNKHTYCMHLVNNGPKRKLHLNGLPSAVKGFTVFVTDKHHSMKQLADIKVNNHMATFKMEPDTYVTLTSLN
jgi:hypothetical protein